MTDIALSDSSKDIGDRALAQNVRNILRFPSDMTDEDLVKANRLAVRLFDTARLFVNANHYRSQLAASIYTMQQEEDWKVLVRSEHVDTGSGEIREERFEKWSDFREELASALGISTGTIGNYLLKVRYGKEVLMIEPERFHEVGGLLTVGHMMEIGVGCDGRTPEHFMNQVRPASEKVREELDERYPEYQFHDQLVRYFEDEVEHNYSDPSAINKSPSELKALARDMSGRPDISFGIVEKDGEVAGISWRLEYPDYDQDGATVTGQIDRGTIEIREWIPQLVLEKIMDRLRIKG